MSIYERITQSFTERASAVRIRTELEPIDGPGGKVFPPTHKGGQYAFEERVVDGETVPAVLLDSVQSQANRMEKSLLAAVKRRDIDLPILEVEIPNHGIITSLDAPHRIYDAIFRDCEHEGTPFLDSDLGRSVRECPNRS